MVKRISFSICLASLFVGAAGLGQATAQELNGSTSVASEELLPASTKAWFSIPDSQRLDEKFMETQLGKEAHNEAFEPFIASLKNQFREWMNEKNVQLGLNLENIEAVRSGEICIAGILPDSSPEDKDKPARGLHGSVLLVDVSQNVDQARVLMEELAVELAARGATKETFGAIHGAEVSKWKFPKRSRLKDHRFAYHTIANGWLLSSDNEDIFRQIVRRLVNIDNAEKGQTLASLPAFQQVMKNVAVDEVEPEILWFVDPFGYVRLAQAIAKQEQEFNQTNSDDWGRILRENGFDGFKGIGGAISLATGKHEFLHRTFVYKPNLQGQNEKHKRVSGLFDFRNTDGSDLMPPPFVSDSVSGYFCGKWNMQSALENIGYAIDTFAKQKGSFDSALDNLRVDLGVDVPKVVSKFANELTVISESELPIGGQSERIVIAIRLRGDCDYIFENLKKSWPEQHREFELCGCRVIEIDESIGAEELDFDDKGIFSDPGLGNEDEQVQEPEEPAFNLFERRFCTATGNYMIIANNKEYLETLLSKMQKNALADAMDFQRVTDSLGELTDESRISFRNFSRLDRVIRPNYEMMREGKMAASDTILTRLLNHVFATRNKNTDKRREQKIDGSKLPSDFDKHVAPFFGPAGWVMETTNDGWIFTGCMLARKDVDTQVVKKEDVESYRTNR